MAEETENLTIRLLQEIRGDMRAMCEEISALRDDVNSRFEDLTTRVDGNTLILNLLAGLLHDHENRVTALEGQGR